MASSILRPSNGTRCLTPHYLTIAKMSADTDQRASLFPHRPYVSQPPRAVAWCEGVFMTTTNAGPAHVGPALRAGQEQPQLTVVAQYIKDFSFENPNAPQSLNVRQEQPQIGIQINVVATPLSETDIEVVIKLDGKAETSSTLLFRFELEFAGVFRIRNVPQESLNPIVLIECPRLLFPFAREIIATAVRNGGFPPLLLDPVDFVSLYRQKMAQAQPTPAPAAGS